MPVFTATQETDAGRCHIGGQTRKSQHETPSENTKLNQKDWGLAEVLVLTSYWEDHISIFIIVKKNKGL